MPRTARVAPGGLVYHVINRGVGRQQLFFDDGDYEAFEEIVGETLEKRPMRILAYCLMPNHWHFLLWPKQDGDLGRFMQRLTVTHVTRWQKYHQRVGEGHVYQGRFKSFPVQTDDYFYQVTRYVERNALRANLVTKAEQWFWSSLWIREHGGSEYLSMLSPWPLSRPRKWTEYVNQAETEAELAALRRSCRRGTPYGSPDWVARTCKKLGLESTLRRPGRPKNP
jgi:putative transposase